MKKEGVYFAPGKEYSRFGVVSKDALLKGEQETATIKSQRAVHNQDYVWWLI